MLKTHKIKVIWSLAIIFLLGLNPSTTKAEAKYSMAGGTAGAIGSEEHQAVQYFGKRLEELSKGQIKVDTFGPEVGNTMSQIERLMDGTQQVWLGELTWLANLHKDINICAFGFAFRSADHLIQFFESEEGKRIFNEVREKNGIRVINFSGKRMPRVVLSKRLLKSVDDFQGLKMRVPPIPIYMKVWKWLGTSTHRVTWGEIYMAMAGGLVEAQEGPPDGIMAIRTHELAPHMLRTDHVNSIYLVTINDNFFQNLPKELQDAVLTAAEDAMRYINVLVDEEKILSKFKEEGTKIIYNDPLVEQLRKKLSPLGPKLEAEGMWKKGLYDYVASMPK
jgi:TRAP-type C4-dicarboxylate transport system substrate-binding protein